MADDPQRDDSPREGLSRRDFLRGGAAAGALGSAGLLVGEIAEAAKRQPAHAPPVADGMQVWGPGPVPVRLRVNGKVHDLKLEPRTTLLDALREELELTGAKRVCDRGTCGACTVLLNGKAVYACSLLAIDVQRQPIQTVEGIGRPADLHPLQERFVENDAQQCGFCTPGFIMAAKALLDHNPTPTLPQVEHALSGNFCRCGTYAGMRKAVIEAAPLVAAQDHGDEGQDEPSADDPGGNDQADRKARRKKKRRGGGDHG